MASEDIPLLNWYLRYPVGPADMDQFQESLVQIPRETFGETNAAALLYGGTVAPSGSTMAVTVTAFSAVNDSGYLCAKNSTSLVAIAASHATLHRYDLIVARPLLEDDQTISRPTSPFDNVPLYELQNCQLAVVQGANGATPSVPAKVAGDVILASVYVPATATSISGGNINQTTHHDIGREPRFDDYDKKNVIVRARSGNTDAIAGYGSGSGAGLAGYGSTGGGPGVSGTGGTGGDGGHFIGGASGGHGSISTGTANGDGAQGVGSGTGAGGYFDRLTGDGTGSSDDAVVSTQNIRLAGANPAAGTGFLNRLTPLNIAKAIGRITLNATTPVAASGFNITNPRYSGGGLLVDLVTDLAAAEGVIFAMSNNGGSGGDFVWTGDFSAAGTVRLSAYSVNSNAAVTLSSIADSSQSVMFLVFGAQNS